MRLVAAARHFDRTLCQDAFAPGTQFYAQLDVYDDSKRDGATVVRRVLSVASGVSIPARRVLTVLGEQWIVGANQDDHYRGVLLRRKYVVQRASAASIQTIAQALGTAGTVSTYASKLWVKDLKEVDISSKLAGFFNIYLPTYETVAAGTLVTVSGRLHIVRNFFVSAAGFLVAEADELALTALTVGTYTPQTYTPATDERAAGTPVALNVLRLRFQDQFAYANQAEPKYEEGDFRAIIRKADVASAKTNDLLTLGGEPYEILAVSNEGDCWGLHLRHADD
jgi:hypothetical protein